MDPRVGGAADVDDLDDATDVPPRGRVAVGASPASSVGPASALDPVNATAPTASASGGPPLGGGSAAEPASVPPSAADAPARGPSRSRPGRATRVLAAVADHLLLAGAPSHIPCRLSPALT